MLMIRLLKFLPMLAVLALSMPTIASPPEQALELLKSRDFDDKGRAVELLADEAGDQSKGILSAFLDARLFHLKKTEQLVFAESQGSEYQITDALSGESLGTVKKRKLRKVSLNNNLRSQIRSALAIMDLRNPDAGRRLEAVNEMLDRPDPEQAGLLRRLLEQEVDPKVREPMEILVALADLQSSDKAARQSAVEQLDGSIHPAVRNGLTMLRGETKDPALAKEIDGVLRRIETKLEYFAFAENLFFGLSLGSVLVLAAIGLAITFGVMGVINMAHGELIMIGAYTTYVIQLLMPNAIGVSVLIAIPAAFVVSGLVGIAIERGVIRFLYGRPLETLLATFGISLVLQQAVRSIFSPLNRSVETPQWMSGVWEINSALSLTYNRLYIIIFCLLVFAALFFVLKRTALGLQVRAVSQNRAMARAMGVRSDRVDALTFGLGSGIAGVAGVALSQLTNVGPNLGQAYIIDSFMVVVFGGVGNLWGTLVSGMTLGVANKFLEPWSGAVLAKILVLVFIILFIQKRPRGLFPQKGRAAEG
jgi:urea transport system permease protein